MNFGLLADPPDRRDWLARKYIPRLTKHELPARADHRRYLLPARDQGNEGACVGFAASAFKEYQEHRDCLMTDYLSPRWIYAKCKERDGMKGQEGTTLRAAMEVLAELGVCLEISWPYRAYQPGSPRPGAEREAAEFRIQAYAALTTRLDMLKFLATSGPFIAGLRIGPEWFDVGPDGVIKDPPKKFSPLGGHAILFCGYDLAEERFLVRNSWKPEWGQGGYGWPSFRHVERCLMSAWSAVDIPGSKLPEATER